MWSIPFLKIYFNLCVDFILKIHVCHLKITFIHIKFHLYSFALTFSSKRFRFVVDCDNLFAFSSIWYLLSLASYFSSTHVIKPGIYFTTFFFLSITLSTFSPSTFFSFQSQKWHLAKARQMRVTWPKQGWKTEMKSSRCIRTLCKGL